MRKMAAVLVALLFLTGCSSVSTEPDQIALHYQGGAFSSKTFKKCINPSVRDFEFSPGEKYVLYPVNTRTFDATGGPGTEQDPFKTLSRDNQEFKVPASVTFRLKNDCPTLEEFHRLVGNKFNAYMLDLEDDDIDVPVTGEGWDNLLRFAVGQPFDAIVDRVAKGYNYVDLNNNPEAIVAIQEAVKRDLPGAVASRTEGREFFQNFEVLVQRPEPTNEALKQAISAEQTGIAKAKAAEAQANADKTAAEAQVAVSQAEAAKRKAVIDGFGGDVEAYNRNECIHTNGCNPYPSPIIPGVAR